MIIKPRELIDFLGVIEKLKCNTRHSWTSSGRHESVAEHSWRLTVMALLVAEDFPEIDNIRVLKMCLIHDFGEAITKDVPSFLKTQQDEEREDLAVAELLGQLPDSIASEFAELFSEMSELSTPEAKLFKALDKMEAIISHNEAPIETWLPLEYEENQKYGAENVAHSDYLTKLREEIVKDTVRKIEDAR